MVLCDSRMSSPSHPGPWTFEMADMKTLKTTLLALALSGIAHAAMAFQEQGGKAPPEVRPATPAAPLNAPSGPSPRSGPEIRIPGLGPVGVLPKFDFGLELLYGTGEPRGPREELNKSEPSDLQIRGTIKYKFNN
jgi:hypothetical protein